MSLESIKVDLSGQNAIVTGASQGLGRSMAVALGAAGAKVALVARNAEKLEQTKKLVEDAGGEAVVMAADVSQREAIEKIVDTVADEWGQLDILVNNAGITRDTLLPAMSDEQWDDVININLRGTFLFTRAAAQRMMRKRYGRIINISSVSGTGGDSTLPLYNASKGAVSNLTRGLALLREKLGGAFDD